MADIFDLLRRKEPIEGSRPVRMIVGLGNPGPEYARNRHNIGFQVVELLAERHGLRLDRAQKRARVGSGDITLPNAGTHHVILVKPLTFMNASGEAAGPLASFFKVAPEDMLVVSDDLDLPQGRLRVRPGGSAGGQKGVQSIIQHLHTDAFPRLRVGIGRPPGKMDPADYVLQNFSSGEETEMAFVRSRAADAIEVWLAEGIQATMNQFNAAGDVWQANGTARPARAPKPATARRSPDAGGSGGMERPDGAGETHMDIPSSPAAPGRPGGQKTNDAPAPDSQRSDFDAE